MKNAAPAILVVCGVSGSGKTTIGKAVAETQGWAFADADDFHPEANVEKMRSGTPLTDEDRWPWLDALRLWIDQHLKAQSGAVLACSALKEVYRQRLSLADDRVHFVFLTGSEALLAERLSKRANHYMPPSLLRSQLDTLEIPVNAWQIDISLPKETVVGAVLAGFV